MKNKISWLLVATMATILSGCNGASKPNQHLAAVDFKFNTTQPLTDPIEKIVLTYQKEPGAAKKDHTFIRQDDGLIGNTSLRLPIGMYEFSIQLFLEKEDKNPYALTVSGHPLCSSSRAEVKKNQTNIVTMTACVQESTPIVYDGDIAIEVNFVGYQVAMYCNTLKIQTGAGGSPLFSEATEFYRMSLRYLDQPEGQFLYRLYLTGTNQSLQHVDISQLPGSTEGGYLFSDAQQEATATPFTRKVIVTSNLIHFSYESTKSLIGSDCVQNTDFKVLGL